MQLTQLCKAELLQQHTWSAEQNQIVKDTYLNWQGSLWPLMPVLLLQEKLIYKPVFSPSLSSTFLSHCLLSPLTMSFCVSPSLSLSLYGLECDVSGWSGEGLKWWMFYVLRVEKSRVMLRSQAEQAWALHSLLALRDCGQKSRASQTPKAWWAQILLHRRELPAHVRSTRPALRNRPCIPWEPAMQCGWSSNQIEVASLINSQRLMNVTMWIHISRHWPIKWQTEYFVLGCNLCVLALFAA